MPERLSKADRVVGIKQLKKALREDRIACVYLAQDADPRLTAPLVELCQERGTPITPVSSMRALGEACQIEVGAAVAGLLR